MLLKAWAIGSPSLCTSRGASSSTGTSLIHMQIQTFLYPVSAREPSIRQNPGPMHHQVSRGSRLCVELGKRPLWYPRSCSESRSRIVAVLLSFWFLVMTILQAQGDFEGSTMSYSSSISICALQASYLWGVIRLAPSLWGKALSSNSISCSTKLQQPISAFIITKKNVCVPI